MQNTPIVRVAHDSRVRVHNMVRSMVVLLSKIRLDVDISHCAGAQLMDVGQNRRNAVPAAIAGHAPGWHVAPVHR